MDDYIKREYVEKVLRDAHINRPLDSDRWVIAQISEGVAKIPAADVRENVPAHWIFDCERVAGDGWTHKQRHCSNCGFQTVECVNFCQNCGADVRGEKDV